MKDKPISNLVFERFALYYRCISKIDNISDKSIIDRKSIIDCKSVTDCKSITGCKSITDCKSIIDSMKLSKLLNIDASLIRHDLRILGKIGKRGQGYDIYSLKKSIANFIGKNKQWKVAMVGIGNLGKAVLMYLLANSSNYTIVKLYDSDEKKQGETVDSLTIENFINIRQKACFDLGIITVPADNAQSVADKLVECGVKAVLNFAPVKLHIPDNIFYREVDVIQELDIITAMLNFNGNNTEN